MTQKDEALKMAIEGYVECLEDMANWAAYASDYFQDKHDLEGNIQAHKQKIQACKKALAELQEHDNEVIERCAKVVLDDKMAVSYQSTRGYRNGLIQAIRALKGKQNEQL